MIIKLHFIIGMFYISSSIKVCKASKNFLFLSLNFLLLINANGLNVIYFKLGNMDVSVLNAYLANLMYDYDK